MRIRGRVSLAQLRGEQQSRAERALRSAVRFAPGDSTKNRHGCCSLETGQLLYGGGIDHAAKDEVAVDRRTTDGETAQHLRKR